MCHRQNKKQRRPNLRADFHQGKLPHRYVGQEARATLVRWEVGLRGGAHRTGVGIHEGRVEVDFPPPVSSNRAAHNPH